MSTRKTQSPRSIASATIGRATRRYSVRQSSKKLLALSERLQRLNTTLKAQAGEHGDSEYGNLTKQGFTKLMENAKCNRLHLPNFNPSRGKLFENGLFNGVYIFKGTQLKSAILSNIGAGTRRSEWFYQENPYSDYSKREFHFKSCNLSGANLDNAGNVICKFIFDDSNLKGTNMAGMISKLHVTTCDAERSNFSGSSFWGGDSFSKE
jgi:hypothetical protein